VKGQAQPQGGGPICLPSFLRPLFWEYDCKALTWEADRDLIIARVLASGG
jgi:hypothetical protein